MSSLILFLFVFLGLSVDAQDVGDRHLVAFRCDWPAVYLTDEGWASDNTTGCLSNPVDILNFCKKVYPTSDVRNIVEFDRSLTVGNWCDFDGRDCGRPFQVRPFRCLTGSFVASNLTVPDSCVSQRIIDLSVCKSFRSWETRAARACNRRRLRIERPSALDPCDVGEFSGIQFACCPFKGAALEAIDSWPALISDVRPVNATADVVVKTRTDAVSENEHRRYVRVKAELHRQHDEEMSKIMDAWDEAQEEVGRMRRRDPEMAEKLERKMTARFQKTISSLEEREEEERHEADADHERNVEMELSRKKSDSMQAYMAVLSRRPPASMRDVFQALRRYVRAEEKDRAHVINHFVRLTEDDAPAAESIRALVAERLRSIRLRLKRALDMLSRVSEYRPVVTQKIQDVIEEYGGFDDLEASIVNVNETLSKREMTTTNNEERTKDAEDNDEKMDRKKKKKNIGENDSTHLSQSDSETVDRGANATGNDALSEFDKSERKALEEDDGTVEVNPKVHPSHLETNELRLTEEKSFKLNRKVGISVGPLVLVVATSVFLVTVTILGVVVWHRYVETRRIRSRLRDDSRLLMSPEQLHVAQMQANGYENPTYKYFEEKTTD